MDEKETTEYLQEICRMLEKESNRFLKENTEKVDHPHHYKGVGMEAIDVIKAFQLNFGLGNAVKYILRAEKKGTRETDLKKAIWYLQKEIELM